MPFHNFSHPFNTKLRKDPAVERWVFQRYFGQFGEFKLNAYSMKWLVILYGIVPFGLYYGNEKMTAWVDQFRAEDVNTVRFGRAGSSMEDLKWAKN